MTKRDKKNYGIIFSVVVISMLLGSVSFAQDIVISPGLTLEHQAALSAQALAQIQTQFGIVKNYLLSIRDGLPPDKSAEKAWIDQGITQIEGRLSNLDRIDVYYATEDPGTPGAAFTEVYNYFTSQGYSMEKLQDVDTKKAKANQKLDDLQIAIGGIPSDVLPLSDTDRAELQQLIENGDVQAATGRSGKKRISIVTVYVVLVPAGTMYTIRRGTAVVIATDQ